jgi:hypothetical protein
MIMQRVTSGSPGHAPETRGFPVFRPTRVHSSPHSSARQYARFVREWILAIGLNRSGYGMYSVRRTEAAIFCRKTANLTAVQSPPGHTRISGTVHYIGVEIENSLSVGTIEI